MSTICRTFLCGLRQATRKQFHTSMLTLTDSLGKYGGTIRQAGGSFAEREKAKEDQYFYNLSKAQLKKLKEESQNKVKYHKEQIEKHEAAIREEEEKFMDRQG